MPALARDYTVIAVDQRGMGLTEKPKSGYDSATLANDLVALMDELGYERFSVVGLDTGMVISYALAADHPERVARLVVGEVALPGVPLPPPALPLPLFLPGPAVPLLFHLTFNRLEGLNEQLVRGREDLFFSFVFDAEATKKLPRTPSGTTRTASPRAGLRCAAASGSTARGMRPAPRTRRAA